MQLDEVVFRRRMVRRYSARPVPLEVLDRVLTISLRAPSAGFSQGVDLLVLEGPEQTGAFFALTSEREFLAEPGATAGLLRAPVVVVPLSDPEAYVARYAESDKVASSLAGLPASDWPTPYWLVDSAFAVMLLLLAATDEGLGALFFRLHRDPAALLSGFGVPGDRKVIGAVAIGYEESAAAGDPRPSPGSPARRPRRPIGESVHRGRW